MQKSNTWFLYALAVAAYAMLFYFWRVAPVPPEDYLLGVLLWMICSLPLALWYQRGQKGLPMFEMLCLAFCAAYSLPVYMVPRSIIIRSQEELLSWEVTTQALLLVTMGVSAMIAAYYAVRKTIPAVFKLDLPITPPQRIQYAYFAMAIGGGMGFLVHSSGAGALGAVAGLLQAQFNLGLIMLGYGIVAERQQSSFHLFVLYSGMAFGAVAGLLTGMLSNAFLPVVVVIFVRWQVRRKFPIGLALVAAVAFLVLNSAKTEYRERAWFGTDAGLGTIGRLGVWVDAVENTVLARQSSDSYTVEGDDLGRTLGRVGLLNKFDHVLGMTPGEVPYFEGKTYNYFLYAFIPRIVWPNKPTVQENQDLVDFSYNLRSPDDPHGNTRIGIGLVAEAYANFGWAGVPAVMSLIGLFFGLLEKMLNGPQSVGGRTIYLATMVIFFNGIGTQAVILFGSMFQIVIANAVIMRPFAIGYNMPQPPRRKRQRVHDERARMTKADLAGRDLNIKEIPE